MSQSVSVLPWSQRMLAGHLDVSGSVGVQSFAPHPYWMFLMAHSSEGNCPHCLPPPTAMKNEWQLQLVGCVSNFYFSYCPHNGLVHQHADKENCQFVQSYNTKCGSSCRNTIPNFWTLARSFLQSHSTWTDYTVTRSGIYARECWIPPQSRLYLNGPFPGRLPPEQHACCVKCDITTRWQTLASTFRKE